MSNASEWNVSAASNNTAAPDGFPEGMAPSGVNDAAREVMAAVARWYQDSNGTLETGGAGNTYTLTTNNTHTALNDIPLIVARVDRANTGTATLNIDSLGAKTIQANGDDLVSGHLVADTVCAFAYNSTNDTFDLLNSRLDLAIGTAVQAYSARLDEVAGLTPTDGRFIVGDGSSWVTESGATARASMGANSANNLTFGTLPDERLSSNVPKLDSQQVWTAAAGLATAPIYLQSTTPGIYLEETDAPSDEGNWRQVAAGGRFILQAINDAQDDAADAMIIDRSGDAIDVFRLNAATFSFNGGSLPIADGGTNATSAAGARTNLGLGSLAQLNTVNDANWSGTDLAIANGGTGSSTASGARSALGLAIGSNVQAYDAGLAAIAGLAVTNGNFIVGSGSNWVAESGSTARASLGLGSLATLSSINNGNWSGTDLAVVNGGTGSGTAAGARTNLGVGTGDSPTFTGLSLSGSSFAPNSATVTTSNDTADEVGFKGAPQRIQNGSYTLLLSDAGKQIYKASGGSGETITIPSNASVAFPIGTIIEIINDGGGNLSVAITSDTLEKFGGSTGTQTLTDNNKAIIEKVTSTLWKYSSTD